MSKICKVPHKYVYYYRQANNGSLSGLWFCEQMFGININMFIHARIYVHTGHTSGFPSGEEELCKGKSEKKSRCFLVYFLFSETK